MRSVKGINVLVTGAAMGLGKLFATNAVKEGAAAVVLWDVNDAALKETWVVDDDEIDVLHARAAGK